MKSKATRRTPKHTSVKTMTHCLYAFQNKNLIFILIRVHNEIHDFLYGTIQFGCNLFYTLWIDVVSLHSKQNIPLLVKTRKSKDST